MSRAIKNLLDEKKQVADQAKALMDENKFEEAAMLKEQLADINNKIDAAAAVQAELERNSEGTPIVPAAEDAMSNDNRKKIEDLRKSEAYTKAFFKALANGETGKTAKNKPEYKPLFDALSETGGTPVGSEGGFLLPIDFDNRIWELRRQYTSLLNLVTVENVTSFSGWRARQEAAATAVLSPLTELTNMTQANSPKFKKIEYTITGYGGFIPISNDLLEDNTVNLMEYLARWFAQLSVNTENAAILSLLDLLTSITYNKANGIDDIKAALNTGLDPANSVRATILTNQSGFNQLDQMKDAGGLPLLQPDPTTATKYIIKGRPVVMMSDTYLPNDASDNAPIYIGDFAEYIDFFLRKPFEFATTNVGGDAWRQNSTEARGIERFDAQVIDEAAAVKYLIATV